MVLSGPTPRASESLKPMVGLRFGRLVVTGRASEIGVKPVRWVALCDCGRFTEVVGAKLRNGHTQSCGCLQAESRIKRATRHGLSHTRTHDIWQAMRRRCSRPDQPNYKYYGARGIKVCDRWQSFDNFLADMGECPEGHELDRIDGDGHYEPGNCRWVTHKENCAKGRRNYGS
jgi:hypothetical protein